MMMKYKSVKDLELVIYDMPNKGAGADINCEVCERETEGENKR